MDEFEASGGRLPHGAQSASASERARPVALRSSRSGWHQLYVEIGGRPIHGCPFDILVSPAATDPTRCEVTPIPHNLLWRQRRHPYHRRSVAAALSC